MKKILLVDNEPPILHSLHKTLQDSRFDIKTAASGSEAIKKVSVCVYDVCFIDLHLSDMDSSNVIRQIRKLSPKSRIIVMSAYYIDVAVKEEIEQHVHMFISKPVDLQHIKSIVLRLMSDEGSTPSDDAVDIPYWEDPIKEKRLSMRRHFKKTVSCIVTYRELSEVKQFTIEAKTFDISHGGVGMHTGHMLPFGYEILFSGDVMTACLGVVMNSVRIDQDLYRIGVAFR